MTTEKLLIIGAGRLGRVIAGLWQGEVVPETRTPSTHLLFLEQGMRPRLRQEPLEESFTHVLFAVPPSAAVDYRAEAERAAAIPRTGKLLMISSTGVYEEEAGGWVEEKSPLAQTTRAQTLLSAEQEFVCAGGMVLRLAGLYDGTSGPHWVYASQTQSVLRGDGWVNLIHRHDAARLAIAALQYGTPRSIYLGCDDEPLSRKDLVAITAAAQAGSSPCQFTGIDGPLGKRCRNPTTRESLKWQPLWRSFRTFISESGR